jgi:hypothetical protein
MVASVTANWICEYFDNRMKFPSQETIDQGTYSLRRIGQLKTNSELDITKFHKWQTLTYGKHGAKGVHLGPHGIVFADQLLADMGLQTGHVRDGFPGPLRFFREWFRPMLPQLYSDVAGERRQRNEKRDYIAENITMNDPL